MFVVTVSLSLYNTVKQTESNNAKIKEHTSYITGIRRDVDLLVNTASKGDRYTAKDAEHDLGPIHFTLKDHNSRINQNENRSIRNEVKIK